ncbi:RNA-binding ATPase activator [Starmerella bacillaris]|uniref:Pre-rRNA-processing protein ESF2 n=1 Tax=Starmerella bacillaris TaxID=1247836 RepID=A0AAV5RMU3_STABA|nr:RNA-binding ATPase activator [Starmerella bacillaris]
MASVEDIMGVKSSDEDVNFDSIDESEQESRTSHFKKSKSFAKSNELESDSESETEEKDESKEKSEKLKILTEEESRQKLKQIKKSGVVYLSSIPPYMKPIKLKQILERFGECGRVYLAPEDSVSYSRRVKAGGNRKKKYTEGWVEFLNKKHAKLAAEVLNSKPIGGKKGSFYYDDILNIKYLPKFKWIDLTEQMALEHQERQEKLKAEIAQATKENRVFIDNVEQKERIEHAKRKAESENTTNIEPSVKRVFTQKPTKPKAKNSEALSSVLSKVF